MAHGGFSRVTECARRYRKFFAYSGLISGPRGHPHVLTSTGTLLAAKLVWRDRAMSLVRLLGFRTLACGCVIGRYRELATSRELTYIEEKGPACEMYGHRRNHTIASDRVAVAPEPLSAVRAS